MRCWPRVLSVCLIVAALWQVTASAQSPPPPAPAAQAEAPKDPLGRSTPRGTVLGFLSAGRKGEDQLARQYIDTPLTGQAADQLANQLFVVLDALLPARLGQLSDEAEGSQSNLLAANQERIAIIGAAHVDIVLERVDRGGNRAIWLFSKRTLDRIPALYQEVLASRAGIGLPRFLTNTRLAGVPLFE